MLNHDGSFINSVIYDKTYRLIEIKNIKKKLPYHVIIGRSCDLETKMYAFSLIRNNKFHMKYFERAYMGRGRAIGGPTFESIDNKNLSTREILDKSKVFLFKLLYTFKKFK